ncbi:HIT family protein [Arthrobacter pityocampae]|uniref:HIT family protein n=1 Tax=Arthrobacter pityocampae TaxID=547334 RepID=UPI0019D424AA
MNNAPCPFCSIVNQTDSAVREVYRNDHVIAFFPLNPATLGHTLVIPRQHVPHIWELSEDSAGHLAISIIRLSKAVKNAIHPDGLNIIQSNGEAATQSVPHIHVHLVPRWESDAIGRIWPPKTSYSEAAKDDVWEKLLGECSRIEKT